MENNRENKILIDWLAFTLHDISLDEVVTLLGFNHILGSFNSIASGQKGYHDCLYYESISIHYNGKPEQGIHVNMSGQGCRAFETYSSYGDWDQLIPVLLSYPKTKITRLDVAYDDFHNYLPIEIIADCVHHGEWSSPASIRWWKSEYSSDGTSAYIGSPRSRIRFRFYDKAAEQRKDYQWSRLEIQMRDEQATQFLILLYSSNISLVDMYFGTINKYIRFINRDSTRTNTCSVKDWWQSFLATDKVVKLWSPGIEYNIGRLKYNIEQRWGNAIQAYINCFGVSNLLSELDENKPLSDMPEHYKRLVLGYAKDFESSHVLKERKLATGEDILEVMDIPERITNIIEELGGD